MSLYIKLFDTQSEYQAAESSLIKPNVSCCKDSTDTVHYNPCASPAPKVVCMYNVTQEEAENEWEISLMHSSYSEDVFESMEVDGVELSDISTTYRFETAGNHTVRYTLNNQASIGYGTFYGCSSLISVDIPSSVTNIGDSAFQECYGLTSVTIPNSVTNVGANAFFSTPWYASYSSDASHVYGNIIYINDIAYEAASTEITSVTFRENTTNIANSAFNNCTSLTSVTIPNSVTRIGDYAFQYCAGITSVTIPNSVTSIGESVFQYCISLTSIVIPNSVTSIGTDAFFQCSGVTSCTIGSGVISIGSGAFYNFSSLTSLTCNATTAPAIDSNTFQNVSTGGTLYVPIGSTGYNVWMQNDDYYLGLYNWTKVEQ